MIFVPHHCCKGVLVALSAYSSNALEEVSPSKHSAPSSLRSRVGPFSSLRAALLEYAAYFHHQGFELPHPFLTEPSDAFVLNARYDLISHPPSLPSSFHFTSLRACTYGKYLLGLAGFRPLDAYEE